MENVFVIARRYPRDRNARANAAFLARVRDRGDTVTSDSQMRLGAALVADALLRWAPAAESFVSWGARHFEGRLATRSCRALAGNASPTWERRAGPCYRARR